MRKSSIFDRKVTSKLMLYAICYNLFSVKLPSIFIRKNTFTGSLVIDSESSRIPICIRKFLYTCNRPSASTYSSNYPSNPAGRCKQCTYSSNNAHGKSWNKICHFNILCGYFQLGHETVPG